MGNMQNYKPNTTSYVAICAFEIYTQPSLALIYFTGIREHIFIAKMATDFFEPQAAKEQAIKRLTKATPKWERNGLYINLSPGSIHVKNCGRVLPAASDAAVVLPFQCVESSGNYK